MSRYRVTSRTAVFGHPNGTIFEAVLPPDQEARMIERGSIRKLARKGEENTPSRSAAPPRLTAEQKEQA